MSAVPRGGRITFTCRVTPRASANAVGGERDGALLVRVTAAPAGGAANKAVLAVLARALGVPPSELRIERGATGRTKVVSAPAGAQAALHRLLAPL